ncbi:hypothetical protein [Streptomyces sp. NPDC056921]|uniref:hypothetical protein n=1 Tax=Streptomyces sp. NPDC056921 TaxID=3345966 RepID=UPI00363BE014
MRQRTDARTEGERMHGSHDGRRVVRTGPVRAGAVLLLAGCVFGPGRAPGPSPAHGATGRSPGAGDRYWVNPDGNAASQVAAYTYVSNFRTARAGTEFGKRPLAPVGGKPFVIDTSRNGNGPYRGGAPGESWCNPPGPTGPRPTCPRAASPSHPSRTACTDPTAPAPGCPAP